MTCVLNKSDLVNDINVVITGSFSVLVFILFAFITRAKNSFHCVWVLPSLYLTLCGLTGRWQLLCGFCQLDQIMARLFFFLDSYFPFSWSVRIMYGTLMYVTAALGKQWINEAKKPAASLMKEGWDHQVFALINTTNGIWQCSTYMF